MLRAYLFYVNDLLESAENLLAYGGDQTFEEYPRPDKDFRI